MEESDTIVNVKLRSDKHLSIVVEMLITKVNVNITSL